MNYTAYRNKLQTSGYAANQKAKGSSPTYVINKKNRKFANLRFRTLLVTLTPINDPASFTIIHCK